MVKEEFFELTRNEAGISETDITVATAEGLQNIWDYPVPTGLQLVFSSEDVFSAYLEDSVPAEAVAGSFVDIVITDESRQSFKSLLNRVRYAQVKEFQDETKRVHLDIDPGKVVIADSGQHVIIRGNLLTVTLDASDSYFRLTCHRVRKSLF